MSYYYLFFILCIGFGLFMAIYPEILFKVETIFIVKDGTPSEYYITKTRVAGIVLCLFGFIALCIILINSIDWYAIL